MFNISCFASKQLSDIKSKNFCSPAARCPARQMLWRSGIRWNGCSLTRVLQFIHYTPFLLVERAFIRILKHKFVFFPYKIKMLGGQFWGSFQSITTLLVGAFNKHFPLVLFAWTYIHITHHNWRTLVLIAQAHSSAWDRKPSEKRRRLCWLLNSIRSASLSPDRRLRLLCLPSPNLNCINSPDYELKLNWTNCWARTQIIIIGRSTN